MRENLSLTTKLIILTFIVNWCEITLVQGADILNFWERDPQFDGRRDARVHENHEDHKVRNTAEKQFRHNRGKTATSDAVKRSGRVEYRSRDESNKPNIIHRDTKSQIKHLRQGKKWPKAHQYYKPKNWNVLRSTRMTPMQLMQQPATASNTNRKALPEELSSYNLPSQLAKIMEKFTEANVTTEILGRTVEYNDIVLLKITESQTASKRFFRAEESKYVDEVPEKKIVFIVHGLSTMGMYLLPCLSEIKQFELLVSYYLEHLHKFDIFLIPLANPDGYAYVVAYWNKNLSPQTACPGVALDRNFDVAWNVSRPISSCSQLYPGPAPFSEAETKAIRDVLHRYSHKIIAYLNVHGGSYDYNSFKGDAILYPKGYTDVQSDDDKYLDLRGDVDEAMKNASFQVLSVNVDTLHNWYGKISGSSVDYASTIYGIPYALELVMQLYENYDFKDDKEVSYYALTEIWKRLIDVIFNNIYKNSQNNNDNV